MDESSSRENKEIKIIVKRRRAALYLRFYEMYLTCKVFKERETNKQNTIHSETQLY